MPITHSVVATEPDDPTAEVKSSGWNADHVLPDVEELPTAETDTTKVLSPDGVGGVTFVAGGGGGLVADPGNAWAPSTAVPQGYGILVGGTSVWQCIQAGTTGTDDPTVPMVPPPPMADYSTVVESTAVEWAYVGEVGSQPYISLTLSSGIWVMPGGSATSQQYAFTQQDGQAAQENFSYVGRDGNAVNNFSAHVVRDGNASVDASALVDNNGNASTTVAAQTTGDGLASVGADAVIGAAVSGSATGSYRAVGSAISGWSTFADASGAHSAFDDGLGIGPTGTPATQGWTLVADADGFPRWQALTAADVGADAAGAAAAAQAAAATDATTKANAAAAAAEAASDPAGTAAAAVAALVILTQAQILTRGLGS